MDLPQGSGPREKLLTCQISELDDRELLTLILGRGIPGRSVLEIAADLEKTLSAWDGSGEPPSLETLCQVRGLGFARAASVLASLELGRRSLSNRGRPVHKPEDALPHFHWMGQLEKEVFQALFLDSRRRLIESQTISVGTLDSSLVHPREVFRPAIRLGASAVLVAHNHPSGDPEPSAEDIALTHRLDKAAGLLGITLLDHLVIGSHDFVSLRERQARGHFGGELFAA